MKNESTGYWAFDKPDSGTRRVPKRLRRRQAHGYGMDVAGLKALDRYTFQIVLKDPYPQLLWVLTMQYAFAVPREWRGALRQ